MKRQQREVESLYRIRSRARVRRWLASNRDRAAGRSGREIAVMMCYDGKVPYACIEDTTEDAYMVLLDEARAEVRERAEAQSADDAQRVEFISLDDFMKGPTPADVTAAWEYITEEADFNDSGPYDEGWESRRMVSAKATLDTYLKGAE